MRSRASGAARLDASFCCFCERALALSELRLFPIIQSRILHWLMAAMLLAMLLIGVTMVASLGDYHVLVARGPAPVAHDPRVSAVRDVPRPPQRGALPR